MNWLVSTLRSSIGKKYVMSLSGICLGLFVIAHLLGNTTAFFGRKAFDSYSARLHELGSLIHVLEVFLLIVFLVHVCFGLSLFFDNLQARPSGYAVKRSAGGRTWGSRSMPYTGLFVLVFLGHHLARFHFSEYESVSILVKESLSRPVVGSFYILSLGALALHISHGFWSLFQTLGISHPKYDHFIDRTSLVLSIVICVTFALIPILALFCPEFLS